MAPAYRSGGGAMSEPARDSLTDSDDDDEEYAAIEALEMSMGGALKKARRRAKRKQSGGRKRRIAKIAGAMAVKCKKARAAALIHAPPAEQPQPPPIAASGSADRPPAAAQASSSASAVAVPAGAWDGEDREERQIAWGEFSLAPVFRKMEVGGQTKKVQIAWGANCFQHRNDPDDGLRCQKQVTVPAHSPQSALDEARRLAKVWLLMGRDVPHDDPAGRSWHLKDLGGPKFRKSAPAWTEAECDSML